MFAFSVFYYNFPAVRVKVYLIGAISVVCAHFYSLRHCHLFLPELRLYLIGAIAVTRARVFFCLDESIPDRCYT